MSRDLIFADCWWLLSVIKCLVIGVYFGLNDKSLKTGLGGLTLGILHTFRIKTVLCQEKLNKYTLLDFIEDKKI